MKKCTLVLFFIILLTFNVSANDTSDIEHTIDTVNELVFTVASPTCTVNGVEKSLDTVVPYISESTSQFMIPIRTVAALFNLNTDWNECEPQTIALSEDSEHGRIMYLYIGDDAQMRADEDIKASEANLLVPTIQSTQLQMMYMQNVEYRLPVVIYSEIKNYTTFISLREFAKYMDFNVEWDNTTKSATLKKMTLSDVYIITHKYEIEDNSLIMHYCEKNNTMEHLYASTRPFSLYVYDENGNKVWQNLQLEAASGTGGETDMILDDILYLLKPEEEKSETLRTCELEEGRYTCEIEFDVKVDSFQRFRYFTDTYKQNFEIVISSDKTQSKIIYPTDESAPGNSVGNNDSQAEINDQIKKSIIQKMNECPDYQKTPELIVSFIDFSQAENIIQDVLSEMNYSIKKTFDVIDAYVLTFDSIDDMESAVVLLNEQSGVRFAQANYIIFASLGSPCE